MVFVGQPLALPGSAKCTVMKYLNEALAVHYNFPLLKFSLYRTFKSGIAAANDPIPWNRGGLLSG